MAEGQGVPLSQQPRNRATDHGFLCSVALHASEFWDFIDKRQIDKHVTAAAVLVFMIGSTIHLVTWSMGFADRWLTAQAAGHVISGGSVAAVLAAVFGPWSAAFSAVVPFTVSFYFKARGDK